jgi:hypothetical protein
MQYTESSFRTPHLHIQLSSIPVFNQLKQILVSCSEREEYKSEFGVQKRWVSRGDLYYYQELLLELSVLIVERTVGIL